MSVHSAIRICETLLEKSKETKMPDGVPSLEGFAAVLEMLARHTSELRGSPYTEEWVRGSIVAAGTKLRALNFIGKRKQAGKTTSLMDLGAQIGSLAIYATRLGIDAAAVDYSYFAEPYGAFANKQGVDYRTCDVGREPLPFPNDRFDYVTYMDVMEHHAYSPKGVFLQVSRVLKPGGCVIVTTPNHASIYNRFLLLMGNSVNDRFSDFFEGSSDLGVYPGHHREYTCAELRGALERTGFKVLECKSIEEDLSPQWRFLQQTAKGKKLRRVWEQRNFLTAMVVGKAWETLALPFGRILWAIGMKI